MTDRGAGFYIASMKWRNQLLALFCLILFFGFGVFYFRYWVIQKPFGIILIVTEGLHPQTLATARAQAEAKGGKLAIDSFSNVALLHFSSAGSPQPDAAVIASAFATGQRVPRGAISTDEAGRPLQSLLALARASGRMTGLVTDGRLTAPSSAAFYGHALSATKWEDLARQLVEESEVDLILGGGSSDFLPDSLGGRRPAGDDLLAGARSAGYEDVQTLAQLEAVPRWRRAQIFGLFGDEVAFTQQHLSITNRPTLADLVRHAIELLQYSRSWVSFSRRCPSDSATRFARGD